jgi:hypothetical protein
MVPEFTPARAGSRSRRLFPDWRIMGTRPIFVAGFLLVRLHGPW